MPDYGHAVSKAAPGDEEARSVGVHVILNPGRLGARWNYHLAPGQRLMLPWTRM